MVFESVVVDVLNRFLGDYVVNLDTSQLSLGIWAGNETAAVPPSRLPPVLPLTEPALPSWGLGPHSATCRRPRLGSGYVEPGGSCWASTGELVFWLEGIGVSDAG